MLSGSPFRVLWLAATVSALGDGVRWVALPLLALRSTTDPATISLIAVAEQAPWLLVGLIAGWVADRYERRRLLAGTHLARAALMVGFALAVAARAAPVPLIAALGFLLTCGQTLASAAEAGLVPALVAPPRRVAANGRLEAGLMVADTLVGSPLGAALFGLATLAPFVLDAATFLAAAALVSRLPRSTCPAQPPRRTQAPRRAQPSSAAQPPRRAQPSSAAQPPRRAQPSSAAQPPRRAQPSSAAQPPRRAQPSGAAQPTVAAQPAGPATIAAGIREGLRVLWREPVLRRLCAVSAVSTAVTSGLAAILVLYATQTLHLRATVFGLLVALFAVGGAAGAVAAGPLLAAAGTRACLAAALAADALCALALGGASQVLVAGAALAVFGAASAITSVAIVSTRQRLVPSAVLGRVTNTFRLVAFAASPAGTLGAGALARTGSLRTPFLVGAVVIAAAGVFLVRYPAARYAATAHPSAP